MALLRATVTLILCQGKHVLHWASAPVEIHEEGEEDDGLKEDYGNPKSWPRFRPPNDVECLIPTQQCKSHGHAHLTTLGGSCPSERGLRTKILPMMWPSGKPFLAPFAAGFGI